MKLSNRATHGGACLIALVGLALAGSATIALAQQPPEGNPTRWQVDAKTSLAWWQINPHLGHLWASTCPQDPSWQPGEGRSLGWAVNYLLNPAMRRGHSAEADTIVPLYPRQHRVFSICPEAVKGEVAIPDMSRLEQARGTIIIDPGALVTGLNMRDDYARSRVLETSRYPEVRFEIERLEAVQPGDTTTANAVGTLVLRGVRKPVQIPIQFWQHGDGLRVKGQFPLDADELTETFGVSNFALGLGVGQKVWETIHLGLDVILHPVGPGAGS